MSSAFGTTSKTGVSLSLSSPRTEKTARRLVEMHAHGGAHRGRAQPHGYGVLKRVAEPVGAEIACPAHFLHLGERMPEVFSLEDVAVALRAHRCLTDEAFDRFLPEGLQAVSTEYWTPLRVAMRIACWLEEFEIRSVVDIGAGVGKFCVVAALGSRCRFIGFEQRERLVDVARSLASAFQLGERVEFVHGVLGASAVPRADAYYFFNPFGENLFLDGYLDQDVELGDERYDRDVSAAEQLLHMAPAGTYALTYNGFGGRIPEEYRLLRFDGQLQCELRLWRKGQARVRAPRLTKERAFGGASGSRSGGHAAAPRLVRCAPAVPPATFDPQRNVELQRALHAFDNQLLERVLLVRRRLEHQLVVHRE